MRARIGDWRGRRVGDTSPPSVFRASPGAVWGDCARGGSRVGNGTETTMAWKVEYEPERAIAVVTACGVIRNEDAKAQTAEVLRLLKRHDASRVLLDYAEALSELSLPELYWLADRATTLGAPWRLQIAVVLPRTRYRVDSYEFFELVFRNAGYRVSLFEAAAAAADWLASSPQSRKPEPRPVHA
jgi:hypothetical protein